MRLGKRIVVIPDTQVRPGDPTDHFDWIGAAIKDYEPDIVVHLGDHWDMAIATLMFCSLVTSAPGGAQVHDRDC